VLIFTFILKKILSKYVKSYYLSYYLHYNLSFKLLNFKYFFFFYRKIQQNFFSGPVIHIIYKILYRAKEKCISIKAFKIFISKYYDLPQISYISKKRKSYI
jgi:hypothetical protein